MTEQCNAPEDAGREELFMENKDRVNLAQNSGGYMAESEANFIGTSVTHSQVDDEPEMAMADERNAERGNRTTNQASSSTHVNTISNSLIYDCAAIHNGSNRIYGIPGQNTVDMKNYELAANYVEDAWYGRTLSYNSDSLSLVNYRRYNRWQLRWFTILTMWCLLAVALFEEPAVPGLKLPYWATMIFEILCLLVIAYRMYQLSTFVPKQDFRLDSKNIVICVTVVVTAIDMIIYIGMINSAASNSAIRVSRIIRPLFLINMNESKQVRRAFRNIRNTLPEIINVLILFIFSIAVFTLLAFKLFQFRDLHYRDGQNYFVDYLDAFFDLYVLVTTANSPDVMMPAYDYSPWFAFFFIAYIVVNTYIFMNLFLAVIYNSYRAHLKTEIRSTVFWKRRKLENAFDLLKSSTSEREEPIVTYETWIKLTRTLTSPPSNTMSNLYWEVLKKTRSDEDVENAADGIVKTHFLQTANLLNVYVIEDRGNANVFLRYMPDFYLSRPSKFLRRCISHRAFVYFFDLLIILNAICIGMDWEDTEWFFLAMFMCEIVLKVYAIGPKEYFRSDKLWNWFDFIIIVSAFLATIVEAALNDLNSNNGEEPFPREVLDFLMVLRCLRLVRIVQNIEQFRIVIMTIVNIGPSLLTYCVVLLMLYYAFAMLGMELFGGKIKYVGNGKTPYEQTCGNTKLNNSEYMRVAYCNMNFNDVLHSLVTLVVLTVVNQWHIITLGYSLVTSKWARLYFVCFHLIVVILIMNIIVAFVLEAFILEYRLSMTTIETKVEKTIEELGLDADESVSGANHDRTTLITDEDGDENDTYIEGRGAQEQNRPSHRFRLSHGHKNIEVLLQRMFEGELEGEVNEVHLAPDINNGAKNLTLDGVTSNSMTA